MGADGPAPNGRVRMSDGVSVESFGVVQGEVPVVIAVAVQVNGRIVISATVNGDGDAAFLEPGEARRLADRPRQEWPESMPDEAVAGLSLRLREAAELSERIALGRARGTAHA